MVNQYQSSSYRQSAGLVPLEAKADQSRVHQYSHPSHFLSGSEGVLRGILLNTAIYEYMTDDE